MHDSVPSGASTAMDGASERLRSSPFHLAIVLFSFASSALVIWWRELRATSWLVSPEFSGYAGFYRAQIEAMLGGSFTVPNSALGDECYEIGGACVGYFGVAPSILRMPAVIVGVDGDLTPLMVASGYLLSIASALTLLATLWSITLLGRHWQTFNSKILFTCLAILAGPASPVLMATRKDVADEAIVWGAGFLVATLATVSVFVRRRRPAWLWLGVLTASISVGSRPSLVFSTVAIGLVIGIWQLIRLRSTKSLFSVVAFTVIPPLTLAATYLLKFGTVFPDQNLNRFISTSPAWRSILDANGGRFFGVDFIPTHFWDFIRPDALTYKLDYPRGIFFTQSSVVWPVSSDEIYREPAASLTNLIPVGILLVLVLFVAFALSKQVRVMRHLRLLVAVGVASGSGLLATWGHVAMTNRYLVDAWPMMLMLSILGGSVLAGRPPFPKYVDTVLTALVAGLTLVGLLTVLVVMR